MKLSLRLDAIYKMVPYAVTADIGADHGKLIISLFLDKKIPKGYAVENKKGPYNTLLKALKENNLEEDIIPLFSDGLTDLPKSVNTIILAGMGGRTIINILKKDVSKLKNINTIIVDAHNAIPSLRKEILDLGYVIADEKMVKEDNIYYEIIKFIKSDIAIYSESDIEFGPILRNEKCVLFKEKYHNRIDDIDRLLSSKNLPETRSINLIKEKERILNILR